MSEFFDAHICKCPGCGRRFASCEGPLCSCMEDAEDILAEMRMAREEDEREEIHESMY